jgi:hypothetical protein
MTEKTMKKLFLISMFVLAAAGLFAQEIVYTSDGRYMAGIGSDGKYCGQQSADEGIRNLRLWGNTVRTGIQLTNGQWECVNEMLKKYNTVRGDTFTIMMFSVEGPYTRSVLKIHVVCEFTSDTRYNYWAYWAME